MASTSKIRKSAVIRKNRNEKDVRIWCLGLNPHSNGDIFSIFFSFVLRREEIKNIDKIRMQAIWLKNKIILLFK